MLITPKHNCTIKNKLDYLKVQQSRKCLAMLIWRFEQKLFPNLLEMKTPLRWRHFSPLLIGQKFTQKRASTHQHLKICKSQQLEPQLILCYKDCKGHHFPTFTTRVLTGRKSVSNENKTKPKKKKKKIRVGENLDTFFVLHVFFFLFYKMVFDHDF